MKKESNDILTFSDVMVSRRDNNTIGHHVYPKPTNTARYLYKNSNHHSAPKRGIIKLLVHHTTRRQCVYIHSKGIKAFRKSHPSQQLFK